MSGLRSDIPTEQYVCRGWNSGRTLINDLSDHFDLCFVQEHWLLNSQLDSLSFSPQFCSTGVSGMDDSLLHGCPFGGCGIIFRKSLSDRVSHLPSISKRFCALLLSIEIYQYFASVFTFRPTTMIHSPPMLF